MAVSLTIVTAQASNALYIPAGALQGSATNGYSVQVLTNGTPTARSVQVGLVTSTQVQITNGLSEGDLVVIVRTSSSSSNSNSRFRAAGGGAQVIVPVPS
jgi:macrolide-specific efflux system membrane fusion protein